MLKRKAGSWLGPLPIVSKTIVKSIMLCFRLDSCLTCDCYMYIMNLPSFIRTFPHDRTQGIRVDLKNKANRMKYRQKIWQQLLACTCRSSRSSGMTKHCSYACIKKENSRPEVLTIKWEIQCGCFQKSH